MQHEKKKINRCENNLCLGASIKENSSQGKKFNFYSFYTLKFLYIHVKENTQNKPKIFPYDESWICQ